METMRMKCADGRRVRLNRRRGVIPSNVNKLTLNCIYRFVLRIHDACTGVTKSSRWFSCSPTCFLHCNNNPSSHCRRNHSFTVFIISPFATRNWWRVHSALRATIYLFALGECPNEPHLMSGSLAKIQRVPGTRVRSFGGDCGWREHFLRSFSFGPICFWGRSHQ